MSTNNWRIPEDFEGWMRSMDKRMAALERRPVVTTAQEIMGPSMGPWAAFIDNANTDEATLNGMLYMPVGADNSPDANFGWMVLSLAQASGYGIQLAYRVHDSSGALGTGATGQVRRFFVPTAGVGRIYGLWETL